MINFKYTAIDSKGKTLKGTMGAVNETDLEYKLSEIGLELIDATKQVESKFSFSFLSPIKSKEIILLCTHFEQLDRAGVPLTSAIQDLRDSSKSVAFRDMMQNIYESVKSGNLLSQALSEHPKVFSEIFVGLIAAGEKTGTLDKSFGYLGEHLKWMNEIKRNTAKAIRYPIFLFIVLVSVVSVMMVYVIPKLSSFLLKQNIDLPVYTEALISTSDFFQNYYYVLVVVPVVFYFINKILVKINTKYAYVIDHVKLQVPFVGSTLRKIDVARFSEFFMLTFKSGIEIINCLEIAARVVDNLVIKEAIKTIRQDVEDGSSISQSIRNSGQFPNLVIRMFEVGEQTANMSESLQNVKYFYEREVQDSVDRLISFIQPTLTIIMGGILMWISISVFGPLYSSFNSIR